MIEISKMSNRKKCMYPKNSKNESIFNVPYTLF